MDDKETWKNKMTKNTACKLNSNPMVTKHTTVIIPSKEIESLKEQVRQLTAERGVAQELLEALKEIVTLTDRRHTAWYRAKAAIRKAGATI